MNSFSSLLAMFYLWFSRDLSRRYRAAWLEMPNKLHYRDTDQVEAMPYMTSFSQLLLFLDYLQGEYLIYKELGGTIESTRPQLLWHCKRTLNIVISLFASPKMRAQTSPLERIRVVSFLSTTYTSGHGFSIY